MRKIEKYSITRVFLLTLLSYTLVGCGNKPTGSYNNASFKPLPPSPTQMVDFDLDKIIERGKLIVLTNNSYTGHFIYRGQSMGFEYELLHGFAKHLGVDLEIKVIENFHTIFDLLNKGECDIIANNIAITKERKEKVAFSLPYFTTPQVLVQRLPHNWRKLKRHEIKKAVITNPLQLIGKEVHVIGNTSFYSRLRNLSSEIGGEIKIVVAPGDYEEEELIKHVAEGKIDYTITDENIASINKLTYPNIHIETKISFPQQMGWAMRKNATTLQKEINSWLKKSIRSSEVAYIYKKYHENRKKFYKIKSSEFSSLTAGKISEYDDLIKKQSQSIGWDWRLISSLIFQESRFDTKAVSWAGAFGLMQLMPNTAKSLGVEETSSPQDQIKAGIKQLAELDNYWKNHIEDEKERVKFVLASYNAGLGHVQDACRLTEKYGGNPKKWNDGVSKYILLKSKSQYYTDNVVKYGFCRGKESFEYVKGILHRYEIYKRLIVS